MGVHGAGFAMRALFGSNTDRVLRQAPCPALIARPLKPAFTNNGWKNDLPREQTMPPDGKEKYMTYKSDEEIRSEALFQLDWDSRLKQSDIGVTVK